MASTPFKPETALERDADQPSDCDETKTSDGCCELLLEHVRARSFLKVGSTPVALCALNS